MTDDAPPRMTSQRPYLLRALHAWIADNDMTPHLLVDAGRPGVQVPAFAVDDGRIVLNVADRAVSGLELGDEVIAFTARFGGVSQAVRVPVSAVLAIYARETRQGMVMPDDVDDAAMAAGPAPDDEGRGDGGDEPPPKRGGHLRVVK